MLSWHSSHFIFLYAAFQPVLSSPLTDFQKRSNNGLALTPPMGWNTYNYYGCSPNQSIVTSNAQAVADLGLQAAGYYYITVDCGWTLLNRAANGTLQWNPERFPNGPYALAEFIHARGLGFGVYSDGGLWMCGSKSPLQAGSLHHEQVDAESFALMGADLLKYDNCYSDAATGYPTTQYYPSKSPKSHYASMSKALSATGRHILFQVCDWGVDFPSVWAPDLANSWRATNDITPHYRTVPRILNQIVPQTSFAGPGHWLDLDMLEVGNGWTTAEEQTHFSLWAIVKSPLVIGTVLKDNFKCISAASLTILKNPNVISYNQDVLGAPATFRRRWTVEGYEVWAGPLSGDRTVVAVINLFNETQTLILDLPDIGLQSAGGLKDVWNGVSTNEVFTSYSALVQPHGTLLLELDETTPAGYYGPNFATVIGTTTTFRSIYGVTSSINYELMITFFSSSNSASIITISSSNQNRRTHTLPANTKTLTVALGLLAANNNNVTINSTLMPSSLNISAPNSTLYPSTAFTLSGNSTLETCAKGLCIPVGKKIGFLSPYGSASLSLYAPAPAPASSSSSSTLSSSLSSSSSPSSSSSSPPPPLPPTTSKYLNLLFCNNDIAFDDSFTTGTNTRNLTLALNGRAPVRVELPLTGRSSELYSPGRGWQDTGGFGVLLDGWLDGEEGAANKLVLGNVGGREGVQRYGADVVGVEVFW